jgi:hypothetical protein
MKTPSSRRALLLGGVAIVAAGGAGEVAAQTRPPVPALAAVTSRPSPLAHPPSTVPAPSIAVPAPGIVAPAPGIAARARAQSLISVVTLADVGIGTGLRFANLGGRREVFVPLPQSADIAAAEVVLTLDDVSAHEARRSLEVVADDRTVASVALDGKSAGRILRIPLDISKTRDQFLKLTFIYSGAATQDRCIDVRSVGDSLTLRPDSSVEFDIALPGVPDVATTAALMPRDVAVIVPGRPLAPTDITTALTVGRSLAASGRRVTFHNGFAALPDLVSRSDPRRWSRGLVVVGTFDDVSGQIDSPIATVAGPVPRLADLVAIRLAGLPALLVSNAGSAAAARLLGSPTLAAARGAAAISVAGVTGPKPPADRVTFDQLGLAPALADVFGRAEISVSVNSRTLPAGTRMARLNLDIMVAPDGAGERAVVSVFINEHLLGSTVAASGEPTRLDLALPGGLAGNVANIRAVVQRRSAQGDCRFEPQGYPAQILGSSAIVLADAGTRLQDFSDLSASWVDGIEVVVPDTASRQPVAVLGLAASILHTLSPAAAPIRTVFATAGQAPAPAAAFLVIGNLPPTGSTPRVRFDRGRVAVADRGGRTLLDIGGLASGAVAQLVSSGAHPGIWIKPLAADGVLPDPAELRLERGDVAVVDKLGVTLALSTEHDTLVSIAYPDQTSWLTVAERFRPWIIGGSWAFSSVAFLVVLQRALRRRRRAAQD